MQQSTSRPPVYRSTRGEERTYSFEEALLQGLAPDGGLFVPAHVPPLPGDWASAATFPEMARAVLSGWLSDALPAEDLAALVEDALSFPVPLVALEGEEWEGVHVLELFHGPTLSFKDFGARTMARLMGRFLAGRGERLTILVATSGDTGSAVADGFAGVPGIDVVLLYPQGRVSPIQERQLVVAREGVRTFAVAGSFDDCQRMVKAAFVDPDLRAFGLSSANSINIGRLLPQMLYYLWAARSLAGTPPVFCVPSGNLGNLTGGMLAALGGMPVRRFLAAHNANDFFPAFLRGEREDFAPSVETYSNAMDVGAPSNFERLRALLSPEALRERVWGTSVSDEETLRSMRRVFDATGYVSDPHTAVGLEAARRYRTEVAPGSPVVVLSTAHPAKFPETVEEGLGLVPDVPERLAVLWRAETRVADLDPTLDALKAQLTTDA